MLPLCPGTPASWSAPRPGQLGVSYWEYLAVHQPQDVNTVEMWYPSRVLGKEAPVIKAVGIRHLSVHQILRVTLPISVLKDRISCEGCHLAREAVPVAHCSESHTFSPSSPAVSRLWAGRSRAAEFQADAWPWLLPYHIP